MNRTRASLAVVALLATGCVSNSGDDELPPALQAQMDDALRRVKFTHGLERLKHLRKLSAFGSHATRRVENELLRSDDPALRSNAVFVLGEIHRLDGDERALKAVRRALRDEDRTVRLEAARALLEAGDRSGLDELFSALDDPRRELRVSAFLALQVAAGGRDFGYRPDLPDAPRRAAVERMRRFFEGGGDVGVRAESAAAGGADEGPSER